MTETTCSGCGTEFTTDRDAVTPGQDTTRCPACGAKNSVAATDGGADAADASVAVEEGGGEVHIHIHIHRE